MRQPVRYANHTACNTAATVRLPAWYVNHTAATLRQPYGMPNKQPATQQQPGDKRTVCQPHSNNIETTCAVCKSHSLIHSSNHETNVRYAKHTTATWRQPYGMSITQPAIQQQPGYNRTVCQSYSLPYSSNLETTVWHANHTACHTAATWRQPYSMPITQPAIQQQPGDNRMICQSHSLPYSSNLDTTVQYANHTAYHTAATWRQPYGMPITQPAIQLLPGDNRTVCQSYSLPYSSNLETTAWYANHTACHTAATWIQPYGMPIIQPTIQQQPGDNRMACQSHSLHTAATWRQPYSMPIAQPAIQQQPGDNHIVCQSHSLPSPVRKKRFLNPVIHPTRDSDKVTLIMWKC